MYILSKRTIMQIFTDLFFFATHFNMDPKKIQWCILEDKSNPCRFLLGIKNKDSKIVISVEERKLRRLKRGKLVALDAILKKNKRGYKLQSIKPLVATGKKIILSFKEKDLADLYYDQWYDASMEPKKHCS